jgi:hypothetical protein
MWSTTPPTGQSHWSVRLPHVPTARYTCSNQHKKLWCGTAGRPLITTPTITNTPIYRATSMTVLSASTGLHYTFLLVAPRKRLMDFLYNTHNPDSSSKHSIPKSYYWWCLSCRILNTNSLKNPGKCNVWNMAFRTLWIFEFEQSIYTTAKVCQSVWSCFSQTVHHSMKLPIGEAIHEKSLILLQFEK